MPSGPIVVLIALLLASPVAGAQTSKQTTARKPAAKSQTAKKAPAAPAKPAATKASATRTEPIAMKCPAELGTGVTTRRTFCDVLTGIDPAEGILLPLPARTGATYLSFDLHNRHTYSEAQTKAGKAFARYTATIVLANLKGEVLGRATVLSEFRKGQDLVDRVSGGAGPGGVKAVAPTGTESIVFEVPDDVTEVVLLGERLVVQRADNREVFSAAGRPIAVVSNPVLEYQPKPAPKPAAKKPAAKKPAAKKPTTKAPAKKSTTKR
jgi:hypothetical protein